MVEVVKKNRGRVSYPASRFEWLIIYTHRLCWGILSEVIAEQKVQAMVTALALSAFCAVPWMYLIGFQPQTSSSLNQCWGWRHQDSYQYRTQALDSRRSKSLHRPSYPMPILAARYSLQ